MLGRLDYFGGNAFRLLRRWDELVGRPANLVLTSPPYWGLRGYAAGPGHWGASGEDLATWLGHGVEFGRLAAEVTTPDAWLVVNLGDTRTGSGGAGGDYSEGGGYAGRARWKQGAATLPTGDLLDAGQLASVPFRFAAALAEAGTWLLRSHVVWVKPGPRPESAEHVRRPRHRWESVLLFARSGAKPYYEPEREHFSDDVWVLPRAHLPRVTPKPKAPWPTELVAAIVDPMTRPGDLVLDPFAGSGVTGLQARRMGRDAVMIDADRDAMETYLALSKRM